MKKHTNNQTEFNMRITATTKQSRVHWNSSKTKPNWKFNSKKKEKKNHQLGVPGGRSGFRIHTPQKPSKASKNSKP